MATNIKRLSKILVSSLFLLISFPLLYVSKTLFRNTSNTMILYYHTVQNEFKENFIWQIEALNKFGRILKLDTESKLNDATRKYIITFDDGFISVFNNALPEMLKRNIPSIIFIPTGYIGERATWGEYKNLDIESEMVAGSDDLSKLKKNKLVTLGSHTISHPILSNLSTNDVFHELNKSKEVLEKLTGEKILYFSFPHGVYNSNILEIANNIGYKYVFSIEPGFTSLSENEFIKKRVSVNDTDFKVEFILKILGGYNWISIWGRIKKLFLISKK